MDKKKNLLGVSIDDINVVRAMEIVKEYMKTEALNTIGLITIDVLLEASGSEKYQETLRQLDLSLIGDREVLDAAGIRSAERRMEAENQWFIRTFLEYMSDAEKSLMLIGENEEEKEEILCYLTEHYPKLRIVGSCVPDDAKEDVDGIVNLVNGISPDVLFAALSSPDQEKFMAENKAKLGARILIGAGKTFCSSESSELKPGFWERIWKKRKLRKIKEHE